MFPLPVGNTKAPFVFGQASLCSLTRVEHERPERDAALAQPSDFGVPDLAVAVGALADVQLTFLESISSPA